MTVATIAKRASIYIPPDNRKCYIKRLKVDGTYDADWLDISEYVVTYPTIKQGFPDDVFVGEYTDEDVSVSVDNSKKKFNDVIDFDSFFYGYMTRYKTLFKFEIWAVEEDESDLLLKAWYGISFSNPSTNDASEMVFSLSSTVKILNNYSATDLDLTTADTETLVTRLLNLEKDGVKLFEKYFTGFSINPDSTAVTTISRPYVKEDATVLDKLREYSFYDDFFYYVDNQGYLVWTNREETATLEWEFNGAGQTDSTYPTNIQSISSYYNDIDNTYTKVVISFKENEVLDRNFLSGVRYDDGTATYLTEANSQTIYAQLITDGYMGLDSRLTQKYITDRSTLDAYLLTTWTAYQVNIIEKLDASLRKESKTATKATTWTVGDGSVADIYGEKVFTATYDELVQSEAEAIAQRVLDAYKNPREVIEASVFGTFHLEPKDKIKVNYKGEINVSNPFIIGVSLLGGSDVLGGRTGSINLTGWDGKITTCSVSFDNFDINMKWRSI